jgi:CBS domain-containing protein
MKLDKYKINHDSLIEQAIEMIEVNHARCVIVVSQFNKVVGVISEGDVLRALLKGVNLKSSVRNILNPSFKYLLEKDDEKILMLFRKGITLIPILNDQNELVDVVESVNYFR